jgi:hypothetical protein
MKKLIFVLFILNLFALVVVGGVKLYEAKQVSERLAEIRRESLVAESKWSGIQVSDLDQLDQIGRRAKATRQLSDADVSLLLRILRAQPQAKQPEQTSQLNATRCTQYLALSKLTSNQKDSIASEVEVFSTDLLWKSDIFRAALVALLMQNDLPSFSGLKSRLYSDKSPMVQQMIRGK